MKDFSAQVSESYINLIEKLEAWFNTLVLQLPNVVIAVVVGVIAYFASSYIRKVSVKVTSRFIKNRTVLNLVSNLAAVFFAVIILFMILVVLNLSGTINKILATAGVLGLAVGLALQDPMTNLFSGVFMSVRDLYKIGDLVETNDYFGTIIDIDLRATKLLLPTGQEVVIPNKMVLQNPLKNYTVSGMRRIDLSCGVSYGDDLEAVEVLVRDTISALPAVSQEKPVDVVFNEFGDSSINFIARFWINDVSKRDYLIEQSKAVIAIKKAFDKNDIMIPFPIRTLDFGIRGGVPMDKMLSLK